MGLFMSGFKRPRKILDHYTPPYWGDGSDGVLDADASVTYQAGVDFDKYSGFCIKQYREINWNPTTAQTLTVDEPCRGLVLFSQGDVFIGHNAKITMAKKGSVMHINPNELLQLSSSVRMKIITETLKTLKGGYGGDGGRGAGTTGESGIGEEGRVCQGGRGGGGSAGGNGDIIGGLGGDVINSDIFGCGGKPGDGTAPKHGYAGINGGGGGSGSGGGYPYGAGGGGGSHDGAFVSSCSNGSDGEHTGGFILIIAKGTVTIHGVLDISGGSGGAGGYGTNGGGGGGGAGGGVIAIFASGDINPSGTNILLLGGEGGASGGGHNTGSPGSAGGEGTFYCETI